MIVRNYKPTDYQDISALYKRTDLFGGKFDQNRDSAERLKKRIEADPDAILVAEEANSIVGTVSLIEDGRVAWLFRFAVVKNDNEDEIAEQLCNKALEVLKARGHNQVLVYSPESYLPLDNRYKRLGFSRGGSYTCYWKDI